MLSGGSKETLYRYTAYTYDKQKRLAAYAECDGPDVPSQETLDKHKVSYTYDKDGLVTDIDYAFAQDGITGLRYHYDTNKGLTKISAKGGLMDKTLREYTYDDFGRVSQMVDHYGFADGGNGTITRDYTYDRLGRVTAMTYTDSKDGDQAKETYAYAYDKNSNVTEEKIVSKYAMADGNGINCTKTYTYDNVGRLETSNVIYKSEGAAENKVTEYTYDKVGNRKTEKIGDETTTYKYNGLNQLTVSETKKTGDTGETAAASKKAYTYDRNGNQIEQSDSVTGESAALTYDAAGRLSKYEAKKDNAVVVTQENRYNGNGQRIQKKETQGAEAKVRNYYYQSGTVLYTSDEGGKLASLNLMGSEGNVIATQRKGEGSPVWYLYNKDIRESTSSMVNSAGELAAAYEYDEFGNTTVRAGENFDNEICYTGQVYDQSTGLYYYNARYYDPEDGRFVSQDTYRGEQMEPGTWHLYAYCGNNPVNYVDPSGHKHINRMKEKKFHRYVWTTYVTQKKYLKELSERYYRGSIGSLITGAAYGYGKDYTAQVWVKGLGWKKASVALKKLGAFSYYSYMRTFGEICLARRYNQISKGIKSYLKNQLKGKPKNTKVCVSLQEKYIYKGRWEYTGKVALAQK